jgi:hypothetical protein
LTIAYTENAFDAPGTVVIWHAGADALEEVSGAASPVLSGDASRIFYSEAGTQFTCRMVERSVDATGTLGPEVTIGDPPDALPRTGCSRPIATDAHGSELAFMSTSTNLVPDPVFIVPDVPTDGALYQAAT